MTFPFTAAKPGLVATLCIATFLTPAAHAGDAPVLMRSTATTLAPVNTPNLRQIKLAFGCVVSGTPVEFPNDIVISNTHAYATPAGIKVVYNAPFGNTGVVTLPALAPGKTFFVANAIPGGHPAGAPCSAHQQ